MTQRPDFSSSTFELEDSSPRRSFPWGCVLGGCLGAVLLMIVGVVLTGFSAYWLYSSQLAKYTSEEARPLPATEFSDEQIAEVEQRVESFRRTVQDQQDSENLILTEDDLNALLAGNEDLRGKVYVHIDQGQVRAEVSMPTDMLPGGKGRYFNGDITFEVSLENGELIVKIDQASVAGEPVPEAIMNELRRENLGRRIMQDAEARKSLEQFEKIVVEEDHIVLVPKSNNADESNNADDSSVDDSSRIDGGGGQTGNLSN